MENNVFVSVIIPTLNRSAVLLDTIKQLRKQIYPSFEVIVVDQSDKESEEVISYCKKYQITYIHNEQKGTTIARNTGALQAKGDILIFLDDDITINTNRLIQYYVDDLISDTTIGIVTGRILQYDNITVDQIHEVGIFNPLTGYIASNWNYDKKIFVHNIGGGNCAIKKDIFERVGMSNILFGYNFFFEETEFALRVEKLGYQILFDPRTEITHLQAPHGGARQPDPYRYMMGYCYNYAVLLLCNYPWWYFLVFFFQQVVKRFISFMLKGFRKERWRMFYHAFWGTIKAVITVQKNLIYVMKRKSL